MENKKHETKTSCNLLPLREINCLTFGCLTFHCYFQTCTDNMKWLCKFSLVFHREYVLMVLSIALIPSRGCSTE